MYYFTVFTYSGKLSEKLKFVVNKHQLLKTTSAITDTNHGNTESCRLGLEST